MKGNERQPGGATAAAGAYIGTLMIRNPKCVFDGFQAMTRLEQPVDELPMENVDLSRATSLEAGYTLTEGDDATERRDVFWRGLYLAYRIGCTTNAVGWVRMRDGHPAGKENHAEFQDVMAGVYTMQSKLPLSDEIARLGSDITDTYGCYPETAKLGILTGLYFLDNGEREKRAEYEEQCRQAREEYDRNVFSRIWAMAEHKEFEEIERHYSEPTPRYLLEGDSP